MGLPVNAIPAEKLPQCWSDDVRMNALFAPFRLKSVNPESWEMKMKFWSDMLRVWCKCRNDPIVSAGDAKFAFQRNGRTPACVDIVVEEMFRNGDLSPVTKYHQILHNGPEGWMRWGARLAFKPAALALTAVTSLLPARQATDNDGLPKASIDSTQRFVVESAVKEQATELLYNYPTDVERIGTIEDLMANTRWAGSKETFEVLLGYLVSQGSAVKKSDVIKLADPDKKASEVSESDEALVKLVSAERRLEAELGRLSRESVAAGADARVALQLGNRLAAKNHLRRKHKAQQRVDKCHSTLDNVRHLLQQMREVEVNATIVDTYRTSSEAMKRGMKEGGLDEDAVHDTMDELKEVMDSYNEVEKALAGTVDDCDVAELEAELRELMANSGQAGGGTPTREGQRKDASTLPSPPQDQPTRRVLERDFVFDGEERIIAELNNLGIEDASPKDRRAREPPRKVAVPEGWTEERDPKPVRPKSPKASKSWYPPTAQCLKPAPWNNNEPYVELRQDDRLHPGQTLNVDFTTPPRLYSGDFQVRDHKMSSGVWIYNRDDNSNLDTDLTASTEYISPGSPAHGSTGFQAAPGGERKNSTAWHGDNPIEDLEKRLRNLRGFNL